MRDGVGGWVGGGETQRRGKDSGGRPREEEATGKGEMENEQQQPLLCLDALVVDASPGAWPSHCFFFI